MVKTIWADYKEERSKASSRCIAIRQYRLMFFLEEVRLLLVSHQPLGAESIYKALDETGLCVIPQDVQRGNRILGWDLKSPVTKIVLLWV